MKTIALYVLATVALALAGMMLDDSLRHRKERASVLAEADRTLIEARKIEAEMKTTPAGEADSQQDRFEYTLTIASSLGDEAARVHSASRRELAMAAGGLVLAIALVVFARRRRKADPTPHAGVAIGPR
jgi:hypothetical protein